MNVHLQKAESDRMTSLLNILAAHPRKGFLFLALVCTGMFAYGMYLQQVVGLDPCPMCIVQRYALIGVGLIALLVALFPQRRVHQGGLIALVIVAVFGAFTAARQSWLQWFPPEVMSCGRDLFGMIESFPLRRVIPMVFRGTGDCSKIDWTFLGLTIANWSFLVFSGMALLAMLMFWALLKRR